MSAHPIFTAMLAAQAGLALMVPSMLALAAFVCLLAAVQLQVRLLEANPSGPTAPPPRGTQPRLPVDAASHPLTRADTSTHEHRGVVA